MNDRLTVVRRGERTTPAGSWMMRMMMEFHGVDMGGGRRGDGRRPGSRRRRWVCFVPRPPGQNALPAVRFLLNKESVYHTHTRKKKKRQTLNSFVCVRARLFGFPHGGGG